MKRGFTEPQVLVIAGWRGQALRRPRPTASAPLVSSSEKRSPLSLCSITKWIGSESITDVFGFRSFGKVRQRNAEHCRQLLKCVFFDLLAAINAAQRLSVKCRSRPPRPVASCFSF